MKRFFRFLLFLLLLALAVASVQVWSDRRLGVYHGWRRSVMELLDPERGHRRPEKYTVATGPRVDLKDVNVLAALSQQRVLLARAVLPSVVSIITSKTVSLPNDLSDPLQFFHRHAQGGNLMAQRQLGSGAIVSKEGHIVTNNHVIDGMDAIVVELNDGRRKPARLIGTDPDTDIAVLKIDAGDCQAMAFGDSENVEVGETVMAVGNPFGLEESVTQGIISAKGRRGSDALFDLLQTDAQINPGNSGGPLINVRGELIGINDAIATDTDRFQGVGFAIPAATVHRTMDGILRLGRVIHGYLGIQQRPLDPDTASDKGMSGEKGVVVDSIVPGSPAEKAALKPGDVIQKIDNRAVNNFDDLRRGVSGVAVDATVALEIVRDGKPLSINARIAERPPPEARFSQQMQYLPNAPGNAPNSGTLPPSNGPDALRAVRLRDLAPAELTKLGLPDVNRGVLVLSVGEGSPAADKLQAGDVIEQINQQPVGTVAEISAHLRQLPEGHPVVLSVIRERSRRMVMIGGD